MPKRTFRSRRRDDSEDEPDDLQTVLADTALAHHERTRAKGVSVSAALNDPADGEERQFINGGMKYHEDVMEKRMQEFVEKNLEERFETAVPDEPVHDRGPSAADDPEPNANHLQTPAVAEVSVPGFNTAITKVSLDSREPDLPASITLGMGSSSQEKPRSAPWVPRDLFPKRFGKSKEATSKRSRLE